MRRTGIDISPTRCIAVDAEASRRFRKDGEPRSLRVRNYLDVPRPATDESLTSELKSLIEQRGFPRHAWINFWDVPSSHQYVLLPTARRAELEDAARRHGAAALGQYPQDVAVGVSIGEERSEPAHPSKTEVSFFAASLDEIRSRLKPIVDAGFVVDGVTTPCGALWSQARLRRPCLPGDVHAFVALSATMSSLAMFANGFLLYARDLSWGYLENPGGSSMDRETLAARLVTELRRSFLYLKQYWEQDVSQVLLCGDMPEIRSLTAPLIHRLNMEVETLDTLEGIDMALPEPSGPFTERVAAFRLASAIAVEPTPVNLLPADAPSERVNRAGQRVFVGGAAAAVALSAFFYGRADVEKASAERQVAALQRELSSVRSQSPAVNVMQREQIESPGPRMARILQTVAESTPPGVVVTAVKADSDGDAWHVSIDARLNGANPAVLSGGGDAFFSRLASALALNAPVQPTTRRSIPGTNDVEFTAEFVVSK